jgi:hypothetical protein
MAMPTPCGAVRSIEKAYGTRDQGFRVIDAATKATHQMMLDSQHRANLLHKGLLHSMDSPPTPQRADDYWWYIKPKSIQLVCMLLGVNDKQLASEFNDCLDRIDDQDAIAAITQILHGISVQPYSPLGPTVSEPAKSENTPRAEVVRSLVHRRNYSHQVNHITIPAADDVNYGSMSNSRFCKLPLEPEAMIVLEHYLGKRRKRAAPSIKCEKFKSDIMLSAKVLQKVALVWQAACTPEVAEVFLHAIEGQMLDLAIW